MNINCSEENIKRLNKMAERMRLSALDMAKKTVLIWAGVCLVLR